MLEEEMAGIARFVLECANNPQPYYNEIMKDFIVPSVFFPPAEVSSSAFSFDSYEVSYSWFIKFFAKDKTEAYEKARAVMEQMLRKRRLIPMYDMAGEATGEKLQIRDPKIKGLDGATYQLTVEWDVIRPYETDIIPKMQRFQVDGWEKGDDTGSLLPGDPDYIAKGGND